MAINVDTVYQRVLAILNKEQRGFLTPQKFNLFANQVQLDTLEQYFYDLDLQLARPGNSSVHADAIDILEDKISTFEKSATLTFANGHYIVPVDLYRITSVTTANLNEAYRISRKELIAVIQTPLAQPTETRPVYTKDSQGLTIFGSTSYDGTQVCSVDYIKIPTTVAWAYTAVLGTPQYNASNSVDFDLDPSEETDLVINILRLAGLEVRDLSVYEVANRENLTEEQQEKI
jgi:hypothetical protein|tara:strand:- start:763 stop:1458 length:696 start_codon:yes stop_codon:yes gene_type:complete